MTDFEMQIIKELSEIKSTAATAASAATAAASTASALETRLFDSDTGWITVIKNENEHCSEQRIDLTTRMTVMEEKHKHDDVKDYIHYGTGPFIILIHAVLRHFGIDV